MEMAQIEAFLRVVNEGTVSRAAVSMQRNQSTISMRVAKLERSLGAKLFERVGNRMVLTSAGQSLLPMAERMLALRLEATQRVRAATSNAAILAIGANSWSASSVLPGIVEEFHKVEPDTVLEVQVHSTPALASLLTEGRVEVAFLNPRLSNHVLKEITTVSERCVLVGPEKVEPIAVEDLFGMSFVSYTVGPLLDAQLQLQLSVGRELNVIARSNSAQFVRDLVRGGVGVAFLPQSIVAEDIRSGAVKAISIRDFEMPYWSVSLVSSRTRRPRRELRALIEIVKEGFRKR
jgi:DNA-binding transcriptional LysR family regulator